MGAWGYDIWEDDYALDVKDEFDALLESGCTPLQATQKLIKENNHLLEEKEDDEYAVFYLAIASIQLEHHCLQEDVQKEVLLIIENNLGMDAWKEEGAEAYNQRKKVLMTLKEQLE